MIHDIWTVARKESLEILHMRESDRATVTSLLLTAAVLGIIWPLQHGPAFIREAYSLGYWAWLPMLLVSNVIADSFAGERERHTLESLLATRLPDTAILLGKIAAAVLYDTAMTLVILFLSFITINVTSKAGFVMISPIVLFGALFLAAMMGTLMAGIGVLVSLRAETVRQARQRLSFATLGFFFAVYFGARLIAERTGGVMSLIENIRYISAPVVLVVVGVILAALDVGIIVLASWRFRRDRLIMA